MSKSKTQPGRTQKKPVGAPPPVATKGLRDALRSKSGIKLKAEPVLLPETMVLPGKGRDGLKGVVIYLNEAAKDQLARLSISQHRTVQDLGVEAINLLFLRYREKPIG